METKGDRARLQVWLPVDLLDRIVIAAQEADRPVSREVARRLEASFGSGPSKASVARAAAATDETVRVVERPRVPPEPPVERGRVTEAVAAKKVAVAKAVAATGVVPASEVEKQPKVCPRAHYHRPGRYCTTCDKSF